MPESSPAACRAAIRERTAFCSSVNGLLNLDSALALISFAGRDDPDDFFVAMFSNARGRLLESILVLWSRGWHLGHDR